MTRNDCSPQFSILCVWIGAGCLLRFLFILLSHIISITNTNYNSICVSPSHFTYSPYTYPIPIDLFGRHWIHLYFKNGINHSKMCTQPNIVFVQAARHKGISLCRQKLCSISFLEVRMLIACRSKIRLQTTQTSQIELVMINFIYPGPRNTINNPPIKRLFVCCAY